MSVLELSNTGSKPIVGSDFEGPIRISSANPAEIVKARLSSSTPASLDPSLVLTEGNVLLQPLLLNPGDVVRFTLVSAKGKPTYFVRGRVAGVTEVSVSDAQFKREAKRNWLSKAIAVSLLTIYILNLMEFAYAGIRRRIFMPWSLVTGLIAAFGAALILVMQTNGDQTDPSTLLPLMAIATIVAVPIFFIRTVKKSAA